MRVFDYGRTPEGVFYYAMELLTGATLAEVSELCGPMPAARVISILAQAAGALHEAHSIGLIHRDIKPANIMLVEQGAEPDVVQVLDFGLVKELNPGAVDISHANILTGTPQYLSPEAIRAPGDIDGRSDLYALGAVGYFLLTGEHVFTGSSVVEVCGAHLHTEPVPPSKRLGRAVPEELETILLSCLAKDVAHRPANAAALREQLRAVDEDVWTTAAARAWWSANEISIENNRTKRTRALPNATLDVELVERTAI